MPIRLTPTVKALLIIQVVAFLLIKTIDSFLGGHLEQVFALIPADFVVKHRLWQIFTYMFLHADPMHLLFNALVIAMVGGELEAMWKSQRFLTYFLFCGVSGGIFYILLQSFFPQSGGLMMPMVGSSGAVYGLLVAYGILFSERTMLFMMIFPMKAKHFVLLLSALVFSMAVFSPGAALSSVAHLGGMVGGVLYLWGQARWLRNQRTRKSSPKVPKAKKGSGKTNHLKLVINNVKTFEKEPGEKGEDPKTWH